MYTEQMQSAGEERWSAANPIPCVGASEVAHPLSPDTLGMIQDDTYNICNQRHATHLNRIPPQWEWSINCLYIHDLNSVFSFKT